MHARTRSRGWRVSLFWLLLLLTAGSLATASAAAVAPEQNAGDEESVTTEKVVKKATTQFVEALLDKLGLDYKPNSKTSYLIKLEGVKMLVLIESGGGLMLYCGFQGVKVDTRKINEWNKKHRFSRAYIDDANDPVLESDLDFDGGVTLDSLKIFITVFKSSALEYKKFLAP